jgi:hypothetical protein
LRTGDSSHFAVYLTAMRRKDSLPKGLRRLPAIALIQEIHQPG